MLHGHVYLAHGNDLIGIENIHFYQNTCLTQNLSGSYAGRMWVATNDRTRRRILNNLFVYMNSYPEPANPQEHDIQFDGNLHWCAAADAKFPEGFLEKVREAKGSKLNQAKYPGGWEANSFVGDPHFLSFALAVSAENDYRLKPGSPASGKGIVLPAELADPQRPAAGARPDIGALPVGSDVVGFGRQARVKLPVRGTDPP
jgi:hypothetical protein